MAIVIAAIAWFAHGWWFNSESVLDDHWHQRNLRVYGWSFDALIDATRIEPAAWQHLWWQNQSMYWEYARPVFTGLMKLLYHEIGNDDPWWLHAASFVMHVWLACLVARLAWLLTADAFWSLFAAVLFLLYPHAVVSVAWPSALNCVLHTLLMLGAVLVYVRASGLELRPPTRVGSSRSTGLRAGDAGHIGIMSTATLERGSSPPYAPPVDMGRLLVVFVLWGLSLFTRENSLVLPAILVAFDLAFGGWRQVRRRLPVYAIFAAAGILFVIWRAMRFTHPPPEVYVRLPAGEGVEYPLWLAAKLLHYVCTAVWFAPMSIGPTGRFNPWVEVPGDAALMLGIVALWFVYYTLVARRIRGWWIWPLWILLMVLPVTPVIATPHTGYACGVGVALAMTLPASRGNSAVTARVRRLARIVAWVYLLLSIATTVTNHWQWNAIAAAEKWGNDSILVSPPGPDVTDVFAINLPFVNVYTPAALAHAAPQHFADVRWHILTYAPQVAVLEDPVYVTPLDSHRLEVRAGGQPFFSRLLGRFLREAFREGPGFRTGDRFENPNFAIEIADADVHGVRRMIFTFPKRLDDPSYCFYLASADCGAARLRFRVPHSPLQEDQAASGTTPPADWARVQAAAAAVWDDAEADRAAELFAGLESDEPRVQEVAEASLRAILGIIARASGAREQDLLQKHDLSGSDRQALRAWWHGHVDAEMLREMRVLHEDLSYLLKIREELPHALWWASRVIRSDLYLTGPPFPTSREELRADAHQPAGQ